MFVVILFLHVSCIRFDVYSDNARKAASSYRSLPHWGRGTASAVDRVLSQTAHLRRFSSLFFIPLVPHPARFARHLPHAGKALSVGILFLHVSCIRFDDARKAVDRVLAESGIWRKRISLYRELSFIAKSPYPPFGHLPPVGKAVMREEFFRRTSGIALYIYSRRSRHLHS